MPKKFAKKVPKGAVPLVGDETSALYVRLPLPQAEKLDRAAFVLKAPKREIVTRLVDRYVDPGDPDALAELRAERDVLVGRASWRPAEPAEVMTLDEAAELLQVERAALERLAEDGELPGRRIGDDWRFSRAALLAWLAA
jgi:excisionase family DNA binding protein